MIVMQRLEAVQNGLKILRLIILLLASGQLFISLFNSTSGFLVSLGISIIAGLLYQQKHLAPQSYRLFILLLIIDFIYSSGTFIQKLTSHNPYNSVFILINVYTLTVIILFIMVLWRHYQLSEFTERLQFQQMVP